MSLVREVKEHQRVEVPLDEDQARHLQQVAGDRLNVTPSSGGYSVGAKSHVGTIAVPGFILHVHPKIPVENVLHLMAWSTERITFNSGDIGQASSTLTSTLATIFAPMMERALIMGVDRAYVEASDRLVALRGRIDWPTQLKSVGLPTPTACHYDEWSIDTRANRIVQAAAALLLRTPGCPPLAASALRRLLGLLDGVGAVTPVDLAPTGVTITRLNEHYRNIAALSRLILRGAGTGHLSGAIGVTSFMIDMNAVFEDFVFANLTRHLRGVWGVTKRPIPLDEDSSIKMEPDLLFTTPGGSPVLVADCKYKLTSDGRGFTPDHYQLLAYCTALGLPRGVLIYADADGSVPARRFTVRESGTLLETFRLSLSGPPATLSQQVDRLVEHLVAEG